MQEMLSSRTTSVMLFISAAQNTILLQQTREPTSGPISHAHVVWLIMEQVAIAALDTRALDLAAELIKDIKAKFPESERSTRLAVQASCLAMHITLLQ